ncbi:hypothetical protein A9Q99_07345 [Gammaproteobacteria bacterium 45_16_T64]|nr:hypothetical protein A9Q99_07345 [Gammaproteobacteria bacterium 45_16_T64]
MDRGTIVNFVKTILSLQIVMVLSIGLLLFIGIGESYRVSPALSLTNVCNQAELLESSIEGNLRLGVPIEFQGFTLQANNLADQSDQIKSINIVNYGQADNVSKGLHESHLLTCDMSEKALLRELTIDWIGLTMESHQHDKYEIVLELEDKITRVGSLVITPTDGLFSDVINAQFRWVVIFSLLLIVLMPIVITLAQRFANKKPVLIQKSLYHLTFVVVGFVIIQSLIQLYAAGIKGQSYSLASSLEARLNVPGKLGFDLDRDLTGIDVLFEEYRLKNPDISHIYLIHHGNISQYATESGSLDYYNEYNEDFIVTRLALIDDSYQVVVKTPWSKVYARLWRATRNILVLFIASVLLSNLFLDVLLSIQREMKKANKRQAAPNLSLQLQLIRPVFALGVLMEAINLSFLPAYFSVLFQGSGYSVSTVFGVYFVSFAAILLPAGRWAESHSLRNMMLAGLMLSVGGLGGMALIDDVPLVVALRGIAGVGQGILFIAVQSYLLNLESQNSRLQGTEQLVIGFNMSTISGAAIGALLMPMLGEQNVFFAGSIIGSICLAYCLAMISDPVFNQDDEPTKDRRNTGFGFKFKNLMTDFELYKTVLLIGFPTKALYVGVLIFTMPMLLKELEFDTDVIGQILVFYYLGVLVSTRLVGKIRLWLVQIELILFIGCVGSGLGLILIGQQEVLLQLPFVTLLSLQMQNVVLIGVILTGVLLIGLSHGFIHAPIVSHVAESKNARIVGKATTAAAYRFLERLGHVAGPSLAAFLLLNSDDTVDIKALSNLGAMIIVLGLIFMLLNYFSSMKILRKSQITRSIGIPDE